MKDKKDYKKLYEEIAHSEWFKKAYHDKSLGECPVVIPELEESEDLEEAVKDYFQGFWPGMETAEQCNADMHFTPPAIMRLVQHFYELGNQEGTRMKPKTAVAKVVGTDTSGKAILLTEEPLEIRGGVKILFDCDE